jgi:hypothetical protein
MYSLKAFFAVVSLLLEDGFFHLIKRLQNWAGLFLVVEEEAGLLFYLINRF